MLFFGSKFKRRCGVIIDIGSGSVLTAIAISEPDKSHPLIVWSHREHAPLTNIDSLEKSSKAVMTSLINATILLDSEGRKALREFDKKAKITEVQCSISAPWSHTVTKTINYTQEDQFVITKDLLQELLLSIQQQIESEITKNTSNLSLLPITQMTLDILANDYRVNNPIGNKADNLKISQVTALTQEYVINSINDVHEKVFSGADLEKLSFALVFYTIMREIAPNIQDTCLVDVTYEATEIGIVRDDVLTYCTHTPFGLFSIAREISNITKAPLHESFGYLHTEKPLEFIKTLPATQQEEVETVLEAYTERISQLFQETGDALSIPRHITLHTEIKSQPFLKEIIQRAVKRNIKTEPHIVPISSTILKKLYGEITKESKRYIPEDTALLLSAQFFHTQDQHQNFEYY